MQEQTLYRHTPKVVVGFFILLICMMSAFIYLANSTYTGLFTDNAYKKGLDFAKINQHELTKIDSPFKLHITFSDQKVRIIIKPLANEEVMIKESWIVRPVDHRFDEHMVLSETSPHHYESNSLNLKPGLWEARIKLLANNEEYFFAKKIIVGN